MYQEGKGLVEGYRVSHQPKLLLLPTRDLPPPHSPAHGTVGGLWVITVVYVGVPAALDRGILGGMAALALCREGCGR